MDELMMITALISPISLTDLDRFPPQEVVIQQIKLNRDVEPYFRSQCLKYGIPLGPETSREVMGPRPSNWNIAAYWWDAYHDIYWGWWAWDYLQLAQRSSLSDRVKIENLERLREWIGEEAYRKGEMPIPVPYWAFKEIH